MKKIFKGSYIKFLLGGGSVFVLEYLSTILFTEILGVKSHISYVMALSIGIVFLFYYHSKVTFKVSIKNKKSTFAKFITTYLAFYFMNWYFAYLLMQEVSYLMAIPLVNGFLSIMLYFTYKKVVFVQK